MNDNRIRQLAREARRKRLLGPDAACVLCGITDPPVLTKVRRSLLERHHVAGRANDGDLIVIVCRNCHATLTEGQRNVGADLSDTERHPIERITASLQSLATFFLLLADTLLEWADTLIAYLAALDREIPQWRGVTP